jgi:DNA end-binding protein Ku
MSAMHTMWKGTIRFGLVNIPVKLHAAVDDKDIKFRSLHNKCHTPIKYEKFCPRCGIRVENKDIVRGYEYGKGQFVIFDEKELQASEGEMGEKAVEIIDFVQITDIDPIYFNRSYYLSPNEGGRKAYALLRKAMQEAGRAGIAKITLRSREQLALIRVFENTLVLETIHYPDEVRSPREVPDVPPEQTVTKKELDTAVLLIDRLTTEFRPEKYIDEYREAVLRFVEAKRQGKETVTARETERKENMRDLMAALQASLDRMNPPEKERGTGKRGKRANKQKNA